MIATVSASDFDYSVAFALNDNVFLQASEPIGIQINYL